MRSNFLVLFAALYTLVNNATCPVTWGSYPMIQTDKFDAILTFTSATNGVQNYQIIFSNALITGPSQDTLLGIVSF